MASNPILAVGACCIAVLAAVDVVLPHGKIALLRQRMCDGAGVIAAERLEFFSAQSDDDFIPDDN